MLAAVPKTTKGLPSRAPARLHRSLIVPLPTAIDHHQTANAAYLSDAQAAWRQPQSEFTAQWLADWLAAATREQLAAVAVRARARARTDSADLIADVCERTAGGKQ